MWNDCMLGSHLESKSSMNSLSEATRLSEETRPTGPCGAGGVMGRGRAILPQNGEHGTIVGCRRCSEEKQKKGHGSAWGPSNAETWAHGHAYTGTGTVSGTAARRRHTPGCHVRRVCETPSKRGCNPKGGCCISKG